MYLYVMGRGHSGSTILGILLAGGAAVESLGEIVSGLERYEAGEPCGCGAAMRDCPFWSGVRRRFEAEGLDWAEFAALSRWQTDVRRWPATRLAAMDEPKRVRLATMTEALARAVAAESGKPHVLDSNKEVARALFLLRYLPAARVIHLVRDPRGIQRSHHWRITGSDHGIKFMRRHWRSAGAIGRPLLLLLAAASWTAGNGLCELVARAAPDRVLRVRYEDLRSDPAGTLRRIGATFGLPLEDVARMVERGEPVPVGHNVGGNHVRYEGRVRFDAAAERARPPLPRWAEAATLALCWPLMRRYGYPLRAATSGGPVLSGRARPEGTG